MTDQPRQKHHVSVAILTGGRGQRLGGCDKSQLTVNGETLLQRVLDVVTPLSDDIFLVGTESDHSLRSVSDATELASFSGPLRGIYTALCNARHDLVLVVPCDAPFLQTGVLSMLVQTAAFHCQPTSQTHRLHDSRNTPEPYAETDSPAIHEPTVQYNSQDADLSRFIQTQPAPDTADTSPSQISAGRIATSDTDDAQEENGPFDAVALRQDDGFWFPLLAVYSRRCIPAIESMHDEGVPHVFRLFSRIRTLEISMNILREHDPQLQSLMNINTPQDLEALRNGTLKQRIHLATREKRW